MGDGVREIDSGGLRGSGWLAVHPILGSTLIALIAAVFFSMTFIIEFKERIGSAIDSMTTIRLIDVLFRLAMGAVLVLAVMPLLYGYNRQRGWCGRYLKHMRFDPGPRPRRTVMVTVLAGGALLVLLIGLAGLFDVYAWNPGLLVKDDQWIILLLALVPGIWEELVFRGVILRNLEQRYSPWRSILVSSVLFGLFHLGNFWATADTTAVLAGVVAATVLGVGWGYTVVATGSVIPAMVLHYTVDVLLDAEVFIDPFAGDDAVAPLYLSLIVVWPILTILATRFAMANRQSV